MIEMLKVGYDSIKATMDITKGFAALKTENAVNQAIFEINRNLLDVQRSLMDAERMHAADAHRIAQLEKQIAESEDWNSDKQRYELKAIDSGAFAYMHKPGMDGGEPPVWLCQTCFEKGHKSPLQFRAQDQGTGGVSHRGTHSRWGCNLCKAEVVVNYTRKPSVLFETNAAQPPAKPSSGMGMAKLTRG